MNINFLNSRTHSLTHSPNCPKLLQKKHSIPNVLYHFSLVQYTDSILKNGLICKKDNLKESYPCIFAVDQFNFSKTQCQRPEPETCSKLESLIFYIQNKLGRKDPEDQGADLLSLFRLHVDNTDDLKIRDKRIHHFPNEGRSEEEKRRLCNETLYSRSDYETHPTLATNGRVEFLLFNSIPPERIELMTQVHSNDLPSATECKKEWRLDNNQKILDAFGLDPRSKNPW